MSISAGNAKPIQNVDGLVRQEALGAIQCERGPEFYSMLLGFVFAARTPASPHIPDWIGRVEHPSGLVAQ